MDVLRTDRLHPIDPRQTLVFGLLTFGLLPFARWYQATASYDAALGRGDRFHVLFFTWIGLLVVGQLTLVFGVGFLLMLAALAMQLLLLHHGLSARQEIARRIGGVALAPDSHHYLLLVFGALLSPFLIGIGLIVYQAFLFFTDHQKLVEAAGRADEPPEALPLLGDSDPFVAHHMAQRAAQRS